MTVEQIDFKTYTGNLRIKGINFDMLAQMWEGCIDEYDPKLEEPLAKFYIGKIGQYDSDSYIYNDQLRCACFLVKFANGYEAMVTTDDVVATDEEMTWEEFLPTIKSDNKIDETQYKTLSDAEKEFADKTFLQMIISKNELSDDDLYNLANQAVSVAIYRTEIYSRRWDRSWAKEAVDGE